MKNNNFSTVFKGLIVGGTMLVPGVSGGSMAMILGIYTKLVHAVSSFMKNIKENFLFLVLFCMGGGIGILLFAKPILYLIETYPMPMTYFFLGAVAASIPLILKEAKIKSFSWKIPVYIAIGILVVMLFSMGTQETFQPNAAEGVTNFLLLGVAGFIAAIALILPGISVSYILLIMGLYDTTIKAISEFYLPFLIPLGIGLILGIVLTTKLLEYVMNKFPEATYLIILGFILGSMAEVFPGVPKGLTIITCIITFALGFGAISFLSLNERKKNMDAVK